MLNRSVKYIRLLKLFIAKEHKAYHLYREDAYHEYCRSVDIYGAYQPAYFIYFSFEAFKDACAEQGLSLVSLSREKNKQNEQKSFPWRHEREAVSESAELRGLILRIYSSDDAIIAENALRHGRNVIALIPSACLTYSWLNNSAFNEASEKLKSALSMLNIPSQDWQITRKWGKGIIVNWDEIKTDTPGRLYVAHDAFLSDGFFLKGYGFSVENQRKIESLIKEFACFKANFIRLSYRNVVESWPTGEPLTIVVDVINHGPRFDGAVLQIEVGPQFEALSPLKRTIRPLQSLARTSFAIQLEPIEDGNFPMIVGASASLNNANSCEVHSEQLNLNVRPALGSSQRSSVPQDDETLSRLIRVFHDADMDTEVENLPELARIDVGACLNRIRTITEQIVFKYIKKHGIDYRDLSLDAAIRVLKNNSSFSNKTIGYLHTIRVIGNLGSHANNDPLDDVDVRILSYALASVVEEFMEQNGL